MAAIELIGVSKRYGEAPPVVPALDLLIPDGSFTVLLGPSGCGKTTVLRMIAGLTPASSGRVLIGGRDVTRIDPGERDVAMVFQNYAIYPHMSVEQNISFGLRNFGLPKAEVAQRVDEVLTLVGLAGLRHRRPSELSGGQRQRVALARAISKHPEVCLLDEPLSNLDARLRIQMRAELTELHRRLGSTMVLVTHDQIEAMSMADNVVVMNQGMVQQAGTPQEIYHQPANVFVANFIGDGGMNFVAAGGRSLFGFRPGVVQLDAADAGTGGTAYGFVSAGSVHGRELAGEDFVYQLDTERGRLKARSTHAFEIGEKVRASVPVARGHLFGDDGQRLPPAGQHPNYFGSVVDVG